LKKQWFYFVIYILSPFLSSPNTVTIMEDEPRLSRFVLGFISEIAAKTGNKNCSGRFSCCFYAKIIPLINMVWVELNTGVSSQKKEWWQYTFVATRRFFLKSNRVCFRFRIMGICTPKQTVVKNSFPVLFHIIVPFDEPSAWSRK